MPEDVVLSVVHDALLAYFDLMKAGEIMIVDGKIEAKLVEDKWYRITIEPLRG